MAKVRSVEEQISILKTRLLSRAPFLGFLMLHLDLHKTEHVPIAGVQQDGSLFINEKTFMALGEDEQAFVLAHETLHPALLFWSRLRGRNPKLFNVAHDFAINLLLDEWSRNSNIPIKRPPFVLYDGDLAGQSAEEIYEGLKNQKKKKKKKDGGGGDGGDSGGGSQTGDDKLEGDCRGGSDGNENSNDHGEDREHTLDWKGKLARARQVQDAVMGWGNSPGALQRMIDDILSPKLEWWEILSRWVGENGPKKDYSYRRPSRRSEAVSEFEEKSIFLPSEIPHGFADVVIFLDTSGSCWGDECLKPALAEIRGICEDLELSTRVIVIDTDIHEDITIQEIGALLSKIKGGGGSDYCPAFERINKEGFEGVVIAITDGYITVPASRPEHLRDTLWVVHKGGQKPADWGEVIFMDKAVPEKDGG